MLCILCRLKHKSKFIKIVHKKYLSSKNLETYASCNCQIFTILLKQFSLHEHLHQITLDLTTWSLLGSTNLVDEFFQPQQAYIHSYYELEKLENLANKKKRLIIVWTNSTIFFFHKYVIRRNVSWMTSLWYFNSKVDFNETQSLWILL